LNGNAVTRRRSLTVAIPDGSTAGRRRSVPLTTGGLIGVWMVERREHFGFALKAGQAIHIAGH
jgi:hypothetical protein